MEKEKSPQDGIPSAGKSNKSIIIIVVIVIIIGGALGVYFAMTGSEETNNTNTTTANTSTTNTSTAKSLKDYDGQMLTISSSDGKADGIGKVVYQADKDNLKVYYNILVNDAMDQNGTCGGSAGSSGCGDKIRYEYYHNMLKGNTAMAGSFFSTVVCNKTKTPDDITISPWDYYGANGCEVDYQIGAVSETFLAWRHMEFDSYEEILGSYVIDIHDASQAWYTKDVDGTTEYNIDTAKAIAEGEKVTSYTVEFKEQ